MHRGVLDLDRRTFPGLVTMARAKHPVPSRTRPLSALAPMVLRLKTWESRSLPGLERFSFLYLSHEVFPKDPPHWRAFRARTGVCGTLPCGFRRPALDVPACRGVEQPGSSSGS